MERRDGRILAIEVKLAAVPVDRDVRHLHWLARQIGSDLLDAMVITTGPYAYRRLDGRNRCRSGRVARALTPSRGWPPPQPSS
ncbi:MAG TPA: hypothetical protein VNV42_13920 [Solirubrobacteraceae bacterium]|nr:hypothetical protein [Solirubrobacteraceae bacterium]